MDPDPAYRLHRPTSVKYIQVISQLACRDILNFIRFLAFANNPDIDHIIMSICIADV